MMYRRDAKNRSIDEFADSIYDEEGKLILFARDITHVTGTKFIGAQHGCELKIGDFRFVCYSRDGGRCYDKSNYGRIEIFYKGKSVLSKKYNQKSKHSDFSNDCKQELEKIMAEPRIFLPKTPATQ